MDLDLLVGILLSVSALGFAIKLGMEGYRQDKRIRDSERFALAVYASLESEDGWEFTEEDWKVWGEVARDHGHV